MCAQPSRRSYLASVIGFSSFAGCVGRTTDEDDDERGPGSGEENGECVIGSGVQNKRAEGDPIEIQVTNPSNPEYEPETQCLQEGFNAALETLENRLNKQIQDDWIGFDRQDENRMELIVSALKNRSGSYIICPEITARETVNHAPSEIIVTIDTDSTEEYTCTWDIYISGREETQD